MAQQIPGEPRGIRAVALCALERNGEYLVFEAWDSVKQRAFRRFAGGGIEPGETAEQAVRRELFEELDTGIEDVRLLGVLENIFEHEGKPGHEIVFLFAANATNAEVYASDELVFVEGPELVPARWIAKAYLNDGAEFVPPGALELLL